MDFGGQGRDAARGGSPAKHDHVQNSAPSSAQVIATDGREGAPQAAARPAKDAIVLAAVSTNPAHPAPPSNGVVTTVRPSADGLVHLPADTSLQSIHISGRDLVVQLPDGSKIIIPDGAIYTPHLVIGDVDVPVQNLAALLIDNEVQAAAGPPTSSGGNFAVPPGEIGPGFGISPLLGPNSLSFGTTENRLLFPAVGGPPGETIVTPGGPPAGLTSATETVQEGGLPGIGSHGGDGSNVATGVIEFTAPNQPATLAIDGATITSVGQVIHGANGTLTITSIAAGAVGYSYTLTQATPNESVADVFATKVTDSIGQTASATLTIDPVHDHPTANADVASDGMANFAAINGNVVTGAGDTNAGGADVLGADRPTVVTGVATGTSPTSFTSVGAAGVTITSSEGSLTIHPDGSYSYTRAAGTPGGVTDVFTYQIADADGSTSTTTLTIGVAGAAPSLTIPGVGTAGTVVLESGLATGSAPGVGVTTTGTIAFTPGDPPDKFTINGAAVSVGATFAGAHGALTITSIDTVHDTIGYSYTLTSADPSAGRAATEPVDTFAVVLTDQDGNHVSGSLVISDVEDHPTANADVASDGTSNYTAINGNVVTGAGDSNTGGADVLGADQPTVVSGVAVGAAPASFTSVGAAGVTITSSEGSLTIHPDGSYSYTRAAGTPGGVTDTFTYQLTDADGSTSTTTLSIAVGEATASLTVPTAGSAGTVVLESGLAAGSAPGVGVTTTGTISFTPGDGPDSFTINGGTVSVGATFAGAHGALTITSIDTVHDTIGYSYTLTSADPSAGRAATEPVDTFAVVLTDQDGNHVNGSLVISDVEDHPTANPDVASDGTSNFTAINGNVITGAHDSNTGGADVLGADQPTAVTGIATGTSPASFTAVSSGAGGTTINSSEGSLTIHADGSYSYTRAAGTPGGVTDTFTYQLTDADGSTSSTTLSITVGAATPSLTIPGVGAAGTLVFEAGLPTGSNPGASVTTSGTIGFNPGDGPDSFTINGGAVSVGATFAGAHGTLTITSIDTVHDTIGYSYTLTSADPSVGRAATEPVDSFTVGLTDQDGNHLTGALVISDVEDQPTANPDANSVEEGATISTTALTGVVSNDVLGADRPDSVTGVATGSAIGSPVSGNVGTTLAGALGTLTLNADGSYTYVAKPNTGGGADHFVYTLTDADGSTSTTTLTINVTADSLAAASSTITVDESGLPTGSTANNGSNIDNGTLTGLVSGGAGGDTFTLVTQTGNHGTVTLNANGTFTYTLTSADPGAGRPAAEAVDSFTYKVTDSLGNSTTNTVTVNDVEDHPTAKPDVNSLTEGETVTTTALTGVVSNDVLGADRPDTVTGVGAGSNPAIPPVGGVGAPIVTALGTLTLQSDGSYVYVAKTNTTGGTDHFVYTLTDADGSTSTTTLTISVAADSLAAKSDSVTVDEAGLPVIGSHANNGSNITSGASVAGDVSGGSGGDTFTLVSQTGNHGNVVLNSDGTFTYTLTSADPGAGRSSTEAVDSFVYKVTDSLGNSVTNTVTVNDVEDKPTANPDVNNVTEGATITTTAATGVVSNDVLGADRPDTVTGVGAGSNPAIPPVGGVGAPIATALGTLTLQSDGSYSYTANPGTAGKVDHFVYTLTDADGSTSTTTLNISIASDLLTANPATITVDESGLPTGSAPLSGSNIFSGTLASDVTGGAGGDTFTLNSQTGNHGTVVLNANGTFTYTLTSADPGAGRSATTQVDSFTYTVTDALHNTSTNTVTVDDLEDHPTANPDTNTVEEGATITTTAATGVVSNDVLGADQPDSVTGVAAGTNTASPVVGGVGTAIVGSFGTLTLNADGSYKYVANANVGAATDHFVYTLSDADGSTSTTTLTINITADSLAAASSSITVDESGLPTGSTANNGSNIDNGTLTGLVSGGSGGDTFTLVSQTNNHGNVVLNANGTFTYTLTSADPIPGRAATLPVDSFTYKVTDSLGNSTTNTVTVNDVEDHPTANPDTNTVEEGATVTTTAATGVVSNDVLGADRPDSVTGVAAGSNTATPVVGGVGTSIVGSFGTLTLNSDGSYTYKANPGTTGNVDHFVYTLSDADGSTSTTTLNITITADSLKAGAASATVDESGLPTGSAPTSGSNVVTTTAATGLATAVTGGSGGDTFTLTGSGVGNHGTLVLNSDGSYTYTLTSADIALNRASPLPVDTFTYKVTDSLGNSTTNTLTINDIEDKPSIAPVSTSSANNTSLGPIVTGPANTNFVAGADQPTKVTALIDTGDDNGGVLAPVTSGGIPLVYSTSLTSTTDTLTATAGSGGPIVFTLVMTPGSGAAPGTGSYTFTLDQALDGPFQPISSFSSGGFGAGPNAQGQELKDTTTSAPISLLAGFDTTAGFSMGTATDIQGATPDANVGGVNGSTSGFGIDNNGWATGQLFVVEFGKGTSFPTTGNGGFTAPSFSGPAVDSATIAFTSSKSITVQYDVHYTNGFISAPTTFTGSSSAPLVIPATTHGDISYIEILATAAPSGGEKFLLASASAEAEVANAQLNFSTTVTDADGSTSTGAFSVTVTGPATPIVLDLTGQGVQFVGENAGVTFNYGSGLVSTAWAAPGDGVLALNTGSGLVVNFGVNGGTDLQGLAAYDTNHDGQIDAGDADFSKFGVIVNGQFESLAQLGITSINLTSNNTPYTAADGQVQVAGSGTFTYANGKTGTFADASFATAALSSSAAQSDIAANENASLVGANAAAAAGILAASLGLGAQESLTPSGSSAPTGGGATYSTEDMPQLAQQIAMPTVSAGLDSVATFTPAADSSHIAAPTFSPASSIDLSAFANLLPSGSQLGSSGNGGGAMTTQVVSSQTVPLAMTLNTPTNPSIGGAPLLGGGHVNHPPATTVAQVLADSLPGAGHPGGGSLASLIEGLPSTGGPLSAPNVAGGSNAAVFHAAMMGPGFGAFEFGNELATLTHHSMAHAA